MAAVAAAVEAVEAVETGAKVAEEAVEAVAETAVEAAAKAVAGREKITADRKKAVGAGEIGGSVFPLPFWRHFARKKCRLSSAGKCTVGTRTFIYVYCCYIKQGDL